MLLTDDLWSVDLKMSVAGERDQCAGKTLHFLFQIPITPLSDWPAPSEQNKSCTNVAKEVRENYDLCFTSAHRDPFTSILLSLTGGVCHRIHSQRGTLVCNSEHSLS